MKKVNVALMMMALMGTTNVIHAGIINQAKDAAKNAVKYAEPKVSQTIKDKAPSLASTAQKKLGGAANNAVNAARKKLGGAANNAANAARKK